MEAQVCANNSPVGEKVMGSCMLHVDISLLMNSHPGSSDKSPNRLIHLHNHTLFILITTIFILVMTLVKLGDSRTIAPNTNTQTHTQHWNFLHVSTGAQLLLTLKDTIK